MPTEGSGAKDGHEVTSRANDPRLRWYPRSWRARYGDELTALLDDEYGRSMPARIRLSLVSGGLRQRARQSGLAGDAVPAADGVRAGALVILGAWVAFVVAGASFAKFSEHFDEALPRSLGAHHVLTSPSPCFKRWLERPVFLCSPERFSPHRFRAFSARWRWRLRARALPASSDLYGRDHRRDSAPCGVGQPPPIASTQRWHPLERCSVPGVDIPYRHHLDAVDRVGGYGSRRIELSRAVLTTEAILAAAVALAMVTMVIATAVWWGAMATDAPAFLSASPAGLPGSSWDILLVATVVLMVVAAGTAAVGVVREVRLWATMREG